MSNSPEKYPSNSDEINKTEEVMTDREKELSEARMSGYLAHAEEVKKKADDEAEAKHIANKIRMEDNAQRELFEDILKGIRLHEKFLRDHHEKDCVDKIIAERELLKQIAQKIQDENLRKKFEEEIASVLTSYNQEFYETRKLTEAEEAEIVLGKKRLDLNNTLWEIIKLGHEAISIGGMHSIPSIKDESKYKQLIENLKSFGEAMKETEEFTKKNGLNFNENNLVNSSSLRSIEENISFIQRPYAKGV